MTKENIKNVIKGEVASAWNELIVISNLYGGDSDLANRQRIAWSTLDDLWRTLYPDEEY
jgi:hypothetical protein|nr:MAG TPA: hypothetical protein [Caudoviricetes sp.]